MPSLVGTALSQKTAFFDKMDEHDARNVSKGEHAVGASCAVFNGADVTFDVGDMFVGGSCVEIGMPWSKEFKFVIGEQRINNKPAGLVEPPKEQWSRRN